MLLLQNIAPQFSLYNGNCLYFHSLLYLPDDANITLTKEAFMELKLTGNTINESYDLKIQGSASYARFHQLPVQDTLVQIDSTVVSSSEEIEEAIAGKTLVAVDFAYQTHLLYCQILLSSGLMNIKSEEVQISSECQIVKISFQFRA